MNLKHELRSEPALRGEVVSSPAAARDGRDDPGSPTNPTPYIYDFARPPALPLPDLTRLLGGKGANLVVMATELGLPIPPGFTITTATCNTYLPAGWPVGLDEELQVHVRRLEERTRRRFGDPSDPLLVSVRSGAPVSMPGMMDTILDLGLNDATAAGLAKLTRDPEFADDCLRRFRQMYREIVGGEPPDDPWEQLRGAIQAVFHSWNSDRARTYRAHEGIPDDLGTAVTVQAMVFGNRGADSGTGVLFTRSPATGERTLYGDVMFSAQGEDVVAGTHKPESLEALEDRLPLVGAELRRYAGVLEQHYSDLCDIEFTFEQGKLWLLQVRVGKRSPRAALRIAVEMAEDPGFPCSREEAIRRTARYLASPPRLFVRGPDEVSVLTIGLPASPGIAAGEIVTTSEAAETAAASGRSVILVRAETSPADVQGMARAAGILTARGGLASHAAVVARGWGIPAVVGADAIHVDDEGMTVDGRRLSAGEPITIDGSTGEVYLGNVAGSWVIAPEATTLLAWAAELGIAVASDAESAAEILPDAPRSGIATEDDVLRALLIKGVAPVDQLAVTVASDLEPVSALVGQLGTDGLVEPASGGLRLTSEGKLKALAVFDADREKIGEDRLHELLLAFHGLDLRMKDTVTAWQLRASGDEPVINDHNDAAYDTEVLRRLSDLHDNAVAWITPLTIAFTRFVRYQGRLERALISAREGDQRYVASPRVDSYHSVWFELHEDLIRIAGQRRSDQAATDGA